MLKHKGFSLLEVVLVLVVIGVILLITTRQYQKINLQRNIFTTQTSVQNLMGGLQNFYNQHCNDILASYQGSPTAVIKWNTNNQYTPNDMINTYHAISANTTIINPFPPGAEAPFLLSVQTQHFPFTLKVSMNMSNVSALMVNALNAQLKPSALTINPDKNSAYMEWTILASSSSGTANDAFAVSQANLKIFSIDELASPSFYLSLPPAQKALLSCAAVESALKKASS